MTPPGGPCRPGRIHPDPVETSLLPEVHEKGVFLMENRKEGLSFVFGVLVGTLVGASVAIILAPQSGERTREVLRDRASEYKERAADLASDLREEAEELLERGKTYYQKRVTSAPPAPPPEPEA